MYRSNTNGQRGSSMECMHREGERGSCRRRNKKGIRSAKTFLCNTWKPRSERPNVEGVSTRSGNRAQSAPSRKECVVNGQITILRHAPIEFVHPHPAESRREKQKEACFGGSGM